MQASTFLNNYKRKNYILLYMSLRYFDLSIFLFPDSQD
jgi:hypothetical protein